MTWQVESPDQTAFAMLQGALSVNKHMNRFNAAVAAVRAGTRNTPVKVLIPGDSVTLGEGTGPAGATRRATSWPRVLTRILTPRVSLPIYDDFFCGSGNLSISNYNAYSDQVVVPSDWSLFTANASLGGVMFESGAAITSALAFTPARAFNAIETGYAINTTLGTFTIDVGGSALTTQSAAGAKSAGKVTTSTGGAAATGTINTKRTTGGTVDLIYQFAYDTANPGVIIANAGRAGWTTSDWDVATNPYSPKPAISLFAPDLTIVYLGINNWRLGVSPETTVANMVNLIDEGLKTGSVLVVDPVPSATSQGTTAAQLAISGAIKAAAASRDVPVWSLRDRWGDYPTGQGLGYYFDTTHPNGVGAADQALFISSAIAF